ncbi:MAG: NifU family protein [Gemmataceae bacterium]
MSILAERVADVLRSEVAPALELDPDELEVVEVENGIATLRLGPACHSCSGTLMALVMSIESELKSRIPEVEIVEVVG